MYIPFKLNLTNDHILRLKKGMGVKVVAGMIGRGHSMWVTKTHHNRLMKVHGKKQTFMTLKMSHAHLKHMAKHGGSIWSLLSTLLKGAGKYALKKFGPAAVDYLSNKVKGRISGLGVRKRPARRGKKRGGNIFDSLKNGFESVGNAIKDEAVSTFSKPSSALGAIGTAASFIPGIGEIAGPALGAAALGARLTGNGVRKRRVGGSFALGKGMKKRKRCAKGCRCNRHKKRAGGSFAL
jgi:hypothetical protein